MNTPVRDATPIALPVVVRARSTRPDMHDFWDAPWTLDEEWHPDLASFGEDPAFPDILMIL